MRRKGGRGLRACEGKGGGCVPAVKTTAAPSGRDTTLPLAASSPLVGGHEGQRAADWAAADAASSAGPPLVGGHAVSARASVRAALSCAALRAALRSGGGDDQCAAGRVGPEGSVSNVEVEQVGKAARPAPPWRNGLPPHREASRKSVKGTTSSATTNMAVSTAQLIARSARWAPTSSDRRFGSRPRPHNSARIRSRRGRTCERGRDTVCDRVDQVRRTVSRSSETGAIYVRVRSDGRRASARAASNSRRSFRVGCAVSERARPSYVARPLAACAAAAVRPIRGARSRTAWMRRARA